MSNTIKVLSEDVISKIAAGEVVERPLSIIKELIENSIDANASKITISVNNGGTDYIEISDNGDGISLDDLPLLSQMHATSKINSIDDLQQISSYGFRGEALASIMSVADVIIISAKSETAAYKLTDQKIEASSRSKGTTIIIKNLFRKIPARRKFLKSAKSEESLIRDFLKKIQIIHPEIQFIYFVEDKLVLKGNRYEDKNAAIEELFFKGQKDNFIPILNNQVNATIMHPSLANRRPIQIISINKRLIKSQLISSAVKLAYQNNIPQDLKPQFFIELNLSNLDLDINVHPRKEEVRFSDEKYIFKLILDLVKTALSNFLRLKFESRFNDLNQNEKVNSSTNYIPREYKESDMNNKHSKSSKDSFQELRDSSFSYKPTGKVKDSIEFSSNLFSNTIINPENTYISSEFSEYSSTINEENKFSQYFLTYIVIEKENKLIFIDQHAADERINYEKFSQIYSSNGFRSTPLLVAQHLNISVVNEVEINNGILTLSKLGIKAEVFSKDLNSTNIIITELPEILLQKAQKSKSILNLETSISEIFADEKNELTNIESAMDRKISTLACHSSIRAGDKLSQEQMQQIISELGECKSPYTCPHGRPITWELTKLELEKSFLRVK